MVEFEDSLLERLAAAAANLPLPPPSLPFRLLLFIQSSTRINQQASSHPSILALYNEKANSSILNGPNTYTTTCCLEVDRLHGGSSESLACLPEAKPKAFKDNTASSIFFISLYSHSCMHYHHHHHHHDRLFQTSFLSFFFLRAAAYCIYLSNSLAFVI